MLKLADVQKTDIVYDLGCGDGRIVIAAAKIYGAHAVGIDINPVRLAEANENLKKAGRKSRSSSGSKRTTCSADIHKATVVTLFLLSSVNLKLRPKLLADLKPGTRVVSHLRHGRLEAGKRVHGGQSGRGILLSHKLFLWIIPARK